MRTANGIWENTYPKNSDFKKMRCLLGNIWAINLVELRNHKQYRGGDKNDFLKSGGSKNPIQKHPSPLYI